MNRILGLLRPTAKGVQRMKREREREREGWAAIWGQDMQRICKPHETDVASLLKSSQFAGNGESDVLGGRSSSTIDMAK